MWQLVNWTWRYRFVCFLDSQLLFRWIICNIPLMSAKQCHWRIKLQHSLKTTKNQQNLPFFLLSKNCSGLTNQKLNTNKTKKKKKSYICIVSQSSFLFWNNLRRRALFVHSLPILIVCRVNLVSWLLCCGRFRKCHSSSRWIFFIKCTISKLFWYVTLINQSHRWKIFSVNFCKNSYLLQFWWWLLSILAPIVFAIPNITVFSDFKNWVALIFIVDGSNLCWIHKISLHSLNRWKKKHGLLKSGKMNKTDLCERCSTTECETGFTRYTYKEATRSILIFVHDSHAFYFIYTHTA